MTLSRIRYKSFAQVSFADLSVYANLPVHPFWSHIEEQIDFSFADRLCSVLYKGRGQHPYAPSLKLKIHLVQAYYNLSDRQVEEKIIGDLFIKRFLGLPVDFFGFDHSTIGLDRSRMGTAMFQACHLYILAQMYSKGLWGDKQEQWIIDSFPSNVAMAKSGAYRLIKQAVLQVVQHLKYRWPELYKQMRQSVPLDTLSARFPSEATPADVMLGFSQLVAQAYSLLHWFENDNHRSALKTWKHLAKSEELRAVLEQVLAENSRLHDPDQDQGNPGTDIV